VDQLPHPDHYHYEAAVGWLMLGDPASALEEVERLGDVSRRCPCVLELEWGIHAERCDWTRAAAVAAELIERAPGREFGWVHRAYALRRVPGGGLERAWEVLRPALDRFPQSQIVAYNLACYAAQMGRLDEAWMLFQRALAVAREAREVVCMALADADLKPLWPRIRAVEKP
jgi:tetratricopeptide (TPR) repeat protein